MPEVVGVFQRREAAPGRVQAQLRKMVTQTNLGHEACVTVFCDDRCAIHNAQFADRFQRQDSDPKEAPIVAFLDGYVLNRSEMVGLLKKHAVDAPLDITDQSLVALLLNAIGPDVIGQLNGIFNICAYDKERSELMLASCRHGARHLYYSITDDYVLFGTQPRLFCNDLSKISVNRLALQDMFNFGYVGGTRSMFERVHLLEHGTVISVSQDSMRQEKYWDYSFENLQDSPPQDDLIAEGTELLERAVNRILSRFEGVGIPLSGGLDSRAILAFSSQQLERPNVFHCSWYGREEEIARELCRVCGGNWHAFDPREFDYSDILLKGMMHSDGNVHCHQFWFLPIVERIRCERLANVLLDGYLLDVFLGDTFLVLPTRESYSVEDRRARVNRLWRRCKPIFVKSAFLPSFYEEYQACNRASIDLEMSKISEDHISNFIHRFSFANRSNRYSVALPNVNRQLMEYAYPALDHDLTDFYLRIPPGYKTGCDLYRKLLIRKYPEVGSVPWAKTGRPLNRGKDILGKVSDRFRLRQIGSHLLLRGSLGRLDVSHMGDLNRLFRRNPQFRSAYTDVLQDKRTVSRGIIDSRGIERLVGFIDAGWPVFTLVQSLVTVELWYRKFVDG